MVKSNRPVSASSLLPPGSSAAGAVPDPSSLVAVRPLGSTRRSQLPRHLPPLAPLALARPVVHRLTEPEFPPVAAPSYAPVTVPTAIPAGMPVVAVPVVAPPVVAPPVLVVSEQCSVPRAGARRPGRVAMATLDLEPDVEPMSVSRSLTEWIDGGPGVAAPGSGEGDALAPSPKEVREAPTFLLMDSSPNVSDMSADEGRTAESGEQRRLPARGVDRRLWLGAGVATGLGVLVITMLVVWRRISSPAEIETVVAQQAAPVVVAAAQVVAEEAEVEAAPPADDVPAALAVDPSPANVASRPGRRSSSRAALQRLAVRAKACRQQHRAVGGPEILVWYGVGRNGRSIQPQASVPGALARCLVDAVRRTKFPKRRQMGLEALL